MKAYVGGIVDHSAIEWPPFSSFVIFFEGCSARCLYCHNKHLQHQKTVVDIKTIENAIERSAELIDVIVMSGGEPLEQTNAVKRIARFAKKIGLHVGLETNGFRPENLFDLLNNQLIDKVFLDVKAPLCFKEPNCKKYLTVVESFIDIRYSLLKSIKSVIKTNVRTEFRTTTVRNFIGINDCEMIGKFLHLNGYDSEIHSYVVQECRNDKMSYDLNELKEIAKNVNLENVKVRYGGLLYDI